MKSIAVNTGSPYRVLVGKNILPSLGAEIRHVTKATKAAIISDTKVWPLYKDTVLESLKAAGFSHTPAYVFSAGEQSKNGNTFLDALEFLASEQITRSDCIIALGGGVVGDMAGFTASAYLRGIDYVQVPTSLLACVDSSVGGKTAIDLKGGKNLAGAFYQPKLVVCDTDTLATLPKEVFRDGCAEVIKYAVLFDPTLFDHLKEHKLDFDRDWVISRCVELKKNTVEADEFDRGERQKLNLGHTLGHSIEKASNFSLTHGQAVSIGMVLVGAIASQKGICSQEAFRNIYKLLADFGLPTHTNFSAQTIYDGALSDKKRNADFVNLIIPTQIGNCIINPTSIQTLREDIEMGLSYEHQD